MTSDRASESLPPSAQLEILAYFHCGECLEELPDGSSPKDYSRLSIGWTQAGLQVWCNRHQCNVMHIDFEGQKHPALTWARDGSTN